MAETHLVFRKSNPPAPLTLPDKSSKNHLKLIPNCKQLELFDQTSQLITESNPGKIWAFCANVDQLALQYTREDSVLGFFSVIQDLFRTLQRSEKETLRKSHFMVWADGAPTYKKPRPGGKDRPFWMFHLFGTPLTNDLAEFVKTFLASKIGWQSVGWVSYFGETTFPLFEYREGEPIVFFTKLMHPNGQSSIGYPEIFYRGDEVYLGFGSIPKPMKRAVLGEDFADPLTFTVKMMDKVGPHLVVKVSSNLTIHPCGLTEQELIARCPDWYGWTEKDKELVREYGPSK